MRRPVRGRAAAAELVEQLNSLFGLRHCGRKLPRRDAPERVRADGPLPVAVPRRPRPEPLPRAARPRAAAVRRLRATAARALLAHIDAQSRAAAEERNYERAAWLRRRRERLEALRAAARRPAARHPRRRAARARARIPGARPFDAFWIAGGRVVDWGALPAAAAELAGPHAPRRCARRRGPSWAAGCRPRSSRRSRLVGAWMAAHEPPRARARRRRARARGGSGAGCAVRSVRGVIRASTTSSSPRRRAARPRRAASSAACSAWRSCRSPSRSRRAAAPGSAWRRAAAPRRRRRGLRAGGEGAPGVRRRRRDLTALAARLVGTGVDVRWDEAAPGQSRFYATDPWGNRLEFVLSAGAPPCTPSR